MSKNANQEKGAVFYSPSKLNLFFRILRKRADGYHEIASLYQAINLYDTLSVKLSDYDKLTFTDPSLKPDPSNLVHKALFLFRKKTRLSFHVHIHTTKKIPQQAGLGGGSSNAATTLWALNSLLNYPVSEKDLFEWSKEIGSDVPFFFSKGTAICRGRGEKLEDFSFEKPLSFWVAKPIFGLSTPAVYNSVNVNALQKRDPKKVLKSFLGKSPDYFNDLEPAAYFLEPRLKTLQADLLDMGFEKVILTGSGTSFFCIGDPKNTKKSLPEVQFYQVRAIHREKNQWYTVA